MVPIESVCGLIFNKEAMGRDEFWVQPVRDGSSEFITSVQVVVAQ
jgi:hypothetical protein